MSEHKAKYVEKKTGEVFELSMGTRLSANNEQEPVYHLRNSQHFHEVDEGQLQKHFVKI